MSRRARIELDRTGRKAHGTLAVGFAVTATLLLLGLLAGCVADRPLNIRLSDEVERPAKSVVIFFADALDRTRLDALSAAGRLPNIKRRFLEGGVGVDRAVSSMPSITYPNCSSLITGLFPGHHGIMGNFWFDRYTLTCRYYMTFETYRTVNEHMHMPTLYDLLADHLTLNIQGHTRRGVTRTIDNASSFAWRWIFGRYIDVDRYVGMSLEEVAEVANRANRWPTVIMTYYPGVDEVGHRFGPGSQEYTEALVNIDGVVGRVTGALDQAGLGQSTYYVLMSDHGMAPVGKKTQMNMLQWLRDAKGLSVRTTAIDAAKYEKRFKLMQRYDAVANVDAGRVAMVHLRGARGWPYRPAPAEVLACIDSAPAVLELPAVELALTRAGPDRVRVLSRNGTALIERTRGGRTKQYRIAEYQGDPLEYLADPEVASFVEPGWHSSPEWLAATDHARFPDFVPQVVEMFDSPRTGDVVLMAADGWAFYTGERGGHGSCLRRDMRITLFFAGPDLPRGAAIPHGRLVDIMPTVLGLIGEEHRLDRIGPIDGVNLAEQLRQARALTDPDRN